MAGRKYSDNYEQLGSTSASWYMERGIYLPNITDVRNAPQSLSIVLN